jgi:membrane AbrB-like protein
LISIIILMVLGYIGFYIFTRLKLPSPVILGPFCLTAAVQLAGYCNLTLPQWMPLFLTIGVAISVTQNFDFKLKGIFLDFIITLGFSLILGLVGYRLLLNYGMEAQTAYFSSLPGGGIDLALIAMSYPGADPFRIILYQTIRFFAVVIFYPVIIRHLLKQKDKGRYIAKKMTGPLFHRDDRKKPEIACKVEEVKYFNPNANIFLIAVTFAFGYIMANILNRINFPGANYLGGMLATIIVFLGCKIKFQTKPSMSRKAAQFFKILTCGMLGLKINGESLIALSNEWPILIIQNIITILGCLLLGWVLYRLGRGDLMTCLLETAAGGVVPMAVMSEELGGDVIKVSLFQVLRILCIVILAPLILTWVIPLIS